MEKNKIKAVDNSPGLGMMLLLIAACCLLLANLYYAQPILAEIATSLGMPPDSAGFIVTLSQLGYIVGLLFVAPLGDVIENRKLCSTMAVLAGFSGIAAGLVSIPAFFLLIMFMLGVFATAAQVMVVFAIAMADAGQRGKILGIMACGICLGISLSRPTSSFISGIAGWRAIYLCSGIALLAMAAALYRFLPSIAPVNNKFDYNAILASLINILVKDKKVLKSSILSASVFLGFCMFWSTAPMQLIQNMHFSQNQVTVFTLAGLVTPPAMIMIGRLLDKGWERRILLFSIAGIIAAWFATFYQDLWPYSFFVSALIIDPASSAVTVTIQQTLLSHAKAAIRCRVNSINISLNFLGGATGAAAGPWFLNQYDWQLTALAGVSIMILAGMVALFEK